MNQSRFLLALIVTTIAFSLPITTAQQPTSSPASHAMAAKTRSVTLEAKPEPTAIDPSSASQPARLKMPGPEVQNLMLGTWPIKVKYEPSKEMPNGGTGDGTEVWRPGPGGRSVIEEYHERNARGEFDGFSVGWWDAKAQGQRFVWCANDVTGGCVVPENVAKWEGERLVFTEEREEAGRKVTHAEIFSDITPTSFTQVLQQDESGGELKPTVTIRATKLSANQSQSAIIRIPSSGEADAGSRPGDAQDP